MGETGRVVITWRGRREKKQGRGLAHIENDFNCEVQY